MVRRTLEIRRLALPNELRGKSFRKGTPKDFRTVNQAARVYVAPTSPRDKRQRSPIRAEAFIPEIVRGQDSFPRQVANMLNTSAQFLDPNQCQSKTFLKNYVMLIGDEATYDDLHSRLESEVSPPDS
jgi:hypothetical protein